jgi:hypothetical protein
MKAMRMRAALVVAAAVGVGAALALAVPAGAAVSLRLQSPPVAISLGGTATVDAKGAVVVVPVAVTCQPGDFAYVSVQVTQKVGSGVATGAASQEVTCTGSVQRLDVAVTPYQKAFKKGVAFGQALLTVCGERCEDFQDAHEIQIVAA